MGFQYSVDARLQYDAIVDSNRPNLQSANLAQQKKKNSVLLLLFHLEFCFACKLLYATTKGAH